MEDKKKIVKDFWNEASCGEDLYLNGFTKEDYSEQARVRYELEDQLSFGDFSNFKNKKTLEIGVGLGADHQKLAEAGAILYGIDLTPRAINHTQRRFELFGLFSNLQVADAENLPFVDNFFDAVYSWGVIHHSPNTEKAAKEIYRVLKPNGIAKIMIYHKYSLVGYMLWLRYALLKFRFFTPLDYIYSHHLESPGTKAYSYKDAYKLIAPLQVISIKSPLTHGDLLTSNVGQRHRGLFLTFIKKIWPRTLLRLLLPNHGLFLLITCKKI